jgi:hypothetical protein
MYDEKSYELAEYFLSGEEYSKGDIAELAHVIQAAVEDWFTGREKIGAEGKEQTK